MAARGRGAGKKIKSERIWELEELEEIVDGGGYPRCFESLEQYRDWLALARRTGANPLGFCLDCSPEYQAAMKKAGRCHFQWCEFVEDEDGSGIRGKVRGVCLKTAGWF